MVFINIAFNRKNILHRVCVVSDCVCIGMCVGEGGYVWVYGYVYVSAVIIAKHVNFLHRITRKNS